MPDESLCAHIINSWVAVKNIGALDTAAAPSIRFKYLSAIRSPAFRLFTRWIRSRRYENGFISWMSARLCRMTHLFISNTSAQLVIAPHCLEAVQAVEISDDAVCHSWPPPAEPIVFPLLPWLHDLLGLCPALTSFALGSSASPLTTSYLEALLLACPRIPLQQLEVHRVDDMVCRAVLGFRCSLQALRLVGDMTPACLLALPKCTQLTRLAMICSQRQQLTLKQLGRALRLLPALTVLELDQPSNGLPFLTDAFAVDVAKHHRSLRCLAFFSCRAMSQGSCARILALCPELTLLVCEHCYELTMQHDCNLRPRLDQIMDGSAAVPAHPEWHIKFHDLFEGNAPIALDAVLQHCALRHPVASLELALQVSSADLSSIAMRAGRSLRILDLLLPSEVQEQEVLGLLQQCPALEHIALKECTKLTDMLLVALAASCKHVHRISLAPVPLVTNRGVLAAVSALGSQLESLELEECHRVTGTVLPAIADHCSRMRCLTLQGKLLKVKDFLEFVKDALVRDGKMGKLRYLDVPQHVRHPLCGVIEAMGESRASGCMLVIG